MAKIGLYDVGQKVLVKLEWPGPIKWADDDPNLTHEIATVLPHTTPVDVRQYHAWDFEGLRHVNRGRGPLYLPGIIQCKRMYKEGTPQQISERGSTVYCVHVPEMSAQDNPSHSSLHLLELGRVTEKEDVALTGCNKHQPLEMLCDGCSGEMRNADTKEPLKKEDAQKFMLGLGYVCTIKAFGP